MTEAAFFAAAPGGAEDSRRQALIANRVHPRFVEDEATLARLRELAGGPDRPPGEGEGEGEVDGRAGAGFLAMSSNEVLDQHDLADDEDAILAQLSIRWCGCRSSTTDIHDLDGPG